ncbi:MAG: hypothetical protein A2X86_19080 [Bdellovibrionales bacterium GWA2_49_15]|nr:MAG: hypothetical protein A2X86_19080 [Bdellovibrionales bacterium GWA2_49_15]HAZ14331.1 hypothetical protein [Bdellovibrionales bacterium]
MKNQANFLLILIVALLVSAGCSTGGLKERAELRTLISTANWDGAIDYVAKSDFYKTENVALLQAMELGLLYNSKGAYYQSTKLLNKAKEIHQKLYTVSISSAAKGVLANENYDVYSGASYERSLIHFYLALNHYLLFLKGEYEGYKLTDKDGIKDVPPKKLNPSERRLELQGARAELLDWDSYLKSIQGDRAGKSVFKNDLLAKVFGGMIHEAFERPEDDQIALQLYKDAKLVLFRNYNAYKTYNTIAPKFKSDFNKLAAMGEQEVISNYTKPTSFTQNLELFLDTKILQLTKSMRPGDLQTVAKQIHATDKAIGEAAKLSHRANVGIVLQTGIIPKKVPEKHYYSLESALTPDNPTEGQKAVAKFGSQVIMLFAGAQLGLLPPPSTYSPAGTQLGVATAQVAANALAISFELPAMENQAIDDLTTLQIFNGTGKIVQEMDVPLINPLLDVATEAIAEDSASRYTKLGVRLASKHLTAIAASYGTYTLTKQKLGDFFAKQAAVLQYIGASKAIEASEKADTRYWSTLPADFRIRDFYLDKGSYTFKIVVKKLSTPDVPKKIIDLGAVNIADGKQKLLLNYRIQL